METELWIEGVGFPQFSARGCVQELCPALGNDKLFQRTVNGELVYLGMENDVKYRTIITCQDKEIPAFSHLWRGSFVKVGCMQSLIQPFKKGVTQLFKPWIEGSVQVYDSAHQKTIFSQKESEIVASQGSYVTYRPILLMCLMDFSMTYNEWGAKVGWSMTLEEV